MAMADRIQAVLEKLQELVNGRSNAYAEKTRMKKYLYGTYYNELDYVYAKEYFETKKIPLESSSCSSVRNGNFYGRKLDWIYDETAEFIVSTPNINGRYASVGMASCLTGFTDDIAKQRKYNEFYKIIPFRLVDGINEKGVVVSTNVVPIDLGVNRESIPAVENRDTICTLMIPRYILDNFDTARTAVEYIRDYVALFPPQTIVDMGYEAHYMVADKDETFCLEIIDNAVVIIDITDKPYMTNFYLNGVTFNSDGKVYTPETQNGEFNAEDYNGITPNGSGLERYNIIVENYDTADDIDGMKELMDMLTYTNAYKYETNPFWYTEFVGINNLSVKSHVANFRSIVTSAINKYDNRTRTEGEYYGTWHTIHSVVYDIEEKKMYLKTQEEDTEYVFKVILAFSGNYNDLSNKPTNVSEFTNDSGYITDDDLTENNVMSDDDINEAIDDGLTLEGIIREQTEEGIENGTY